MLFTENNTLMISDLIIKYLNGQATEEEVTLIYEWIDKSSSNKEHFITLKKAWAMSQVSDSERQQTWLNLEKKLDKNSIGLGNFFKYAAIAILFIGVASIVRFGSRTKQDKAIESIVLEIEDTRTTIDLLENSDSKNERLQELITEQNESEIIYKTGLTTEPISYHNLKIPFGKIFKVTLSDGTVAHLNAGSSLKYPKIFGINQDREVFLEGEAFFEVVKDKDRPFIVSSGDKSIEVLGTKFNVNTKDYLDGYNCVLVEGSVKLSSAENNVILIPNQKAAIKNDVFKVSEVKTNTYTSWINGELIFENSTFKHIAKKLSTYYNIEIINNNSTLKNQNFSGTIRLKNSDLESILELLRLDTPFLYEKENNSIIITNYQP